MTDQTETARTPYCTKIRYGITGAPTLDESEMDGSHAPGVGVLPTLIELIYSAARDGKPASVSASVTGDWMRFGRPDGGQVTTHFSGGPDGWPFWLAEEARLHDPAAAVPSAVPAPATDQTAVTEWGAALAADGLQPDVEYAIDINADGSSFARILFAFEPNVDGGRRTALVDGITRTVDGAEFGTEKDWSAAQPEPVTGRAGLREQIAAPLHAFRVSEVRDNVVRRVHGYYASLQGAFAYCEAEERTSSTVATARFELFAVPGGEQWLIHSYYGPDDQAPETSDFVIRRVAVIPDGPEVAVLPASVDRATVLNEAAEAVTGYAADNFPDEYDDYADQLADLLRRLAVEARDGQTTRDNGGGRDALMRAHTALAERAGLDQAALARVRRLHDSLEEETDLSGPDDLITKGSAARRIATALDGWNPALLPYCDVWFEGGGHCVKPAGHRPPGSDDPHVPGPAGGAQQPEPVVTVHAAPDLSPAAQEALGALVEVAKRQIIEEQ